MPRVQRDAVERGVDPPQGRTVHDDDLGPEADRSIDRGDAGHPARNGWDIAGSESPWTFTATWCPECEKTLRHGCMLPLQAAKNTARWMAASARWKFC